MQQSCRRCRGQSVSVASFAFALHVAALCAVSARAADVADAAPGFDPTSATTETRDPTQEWKTESADVQMLIAGATMAGVGAGRTEKITVRMGGSVSRGTVVKADEGGIGVELRGLTLTFAWDKLTPRQYYALGRAYLPKEGLVYGALARYCVVNGMEKEAEDEIGRALSLDMAAWSLVRPVNDYLKEKRRREAGARTSGSASTASKRAGAGRSVGARKGGVGKAGTEHPYLYFGARDIPALRAKMKKPAFTRRMSTLLSHARGCLKRRPKRGRGMSMTRPSLGIAINCAYAYVITGEKQFADRAVAEGFNLLDCGPWNPDHHASTRGGDLGTGEGSLACAIVYDWCYDAMSEGQRDRFKSKLLREAVEVYHTSLDKRDWWVTNYVTNWCGVCHGGMGLAALALYHEDARARAAADTAWKHARTFLTTAVLEDGGGHEGVMYHHYGVHFALFFGAAAERTLGGSEVIDAAAVRFGGYWDAYMQGPDLGFANFNDMNEGTGKGLWGSNHRRWEAGPHAASAALYESRLERPDALLLWAADNGGTGFMYGGASPWPILFRRDAPFVAKKPALLEAVLFRGAGHVIWRSPRLWFAFNGGWISNKSHFNCDLGTFVLVSGDQRLVNDPGYGKNKTADHSTVVIDGKDQRKGTRGSYLRYGSGRGFHYLACDLSECYDNASRVMRHAVMVRGAYIVFLDDVAAGGNASVDCRVQTTGQIETSSGSQAAVIASKDGGRLNVVAAWPRAATVSRGRATISYVKVDPGRRGYAGPIVTVLVPGAAMPTAQFAPSGASATLTVSAAGGRDELTFAQSGGYWLLSEVNGQSARSISQPSARTVKRVSGR